jgi:hypothetical protein
MAYGAMYFSLTFYHNKSVAFLTVYFDKHGIKYAYPIMLVEASESKVWAKFVATTVASIEFTVRALVIRESNSFYHGCELTISIKLWRYQNLIVKSH